MSTNNSIELKHNADEIYQAFNDLLARSSDLTPVMADIADIMESATKGAFADEVSPEGKPWEDLTDLTKIERVKAGYPLGQILTRSEGLRKDIITDFTETSARIGASLPYAAMHQFGGVTSPRSMFPNTKIPARPFLGLGPDDEDEILHVLRNYLSGD